MASVNGISNSSSQTSQTTRTKNDELGKNEFLKLLITQLKYQDPMNPMEDKEFIAQMAQFSSLEQMQNMSSSMSMTQASSTIGMQVTWLDANGKEVKGIVEAVRMIDGEPKLVVDDNILKMSEIKSVEIPKGGNS